MLAVWKTAVFYKQIRVITKRAIAILRTTSRTFHIKTRTKIYSLFPPYHIRNTVKLHNILSIPLNHPF